MTKESGLDLPHNTLPGQIILLGLKLNFYSDAFMYSIILLNQSYLCIVLHICFLPAWQFGAKSFCTPFTSRVLCISLSRTQPQPLSITAETGSLKWIEQVFKLEPASVRSLHFNRPVWVGHRTGGGHVQREWTASTLSNSL